MVGIIRAQNLTLERIEFHDTSPNMNSASSHAWSCYVIASHARTLLSESANASVVLHVASPKIKGVMQKRSHSPSTCCTSNWDIYSQTTKTISSDRVTVKVNDQHHNIQEWIQECLQIQQRKNTDSLLHLDEVYLCCEGKRVTLDYNYIIRHRATAPSADTYFQDKYKWDKHVFQDILWTSHRKALQRLTGIKLKTTLQLFTTGSLCEKILKETPWCISPSISWILVTDVG
jgi:hypothetical protein